MLAGTEYLSSNVLIAYPFQEDARGLDRANVGTHGGSATLPIGAVVDACALVAATTAPLYLTSITDMGASVYQFLFSDQNASAIITATLDATTIDLTKDYTVVTLVDAITGYQIKMVVTPTLDTYLAGCTADTFVETLPLEARTCDRKRYKIESFELCTALPNPDPVPIVVTGHVQFTGGYNSACSYELTDNDGVEVTLDLGAGGGDGIYPCVGSGTITPYTRAMSLIPDAGGNINIQAGPENCYSIVPIGDTLWIHSSCVACCSCEDYANVTKALKNALNHADLTVKMLNTAHDDYESGVSDYNKDIAGRFLGLKMVANGYAGLPRTLRIGGSGYDGSPQAAQVSIEILNNADKDVTITSLSHTLAAADVSYNWTLNGTGGQAPTAAGLAGLSIPKSKEMAIGIRLVSLLTPPVWTGTITLVAAKSGGGSITVTANVAFA